MGLTFVARHSTAIARTDLSRPVALMLNDGLLTPETTFFDYGCGRGGDLHRLAELGYDVAGWDPAYRPGAEMRPSDIVNLGFVINVIEDPSERAQVLKSAWALTRSALVVAARPDWEARSVPGRHYGDGILTAKGTFQRFYAQEELRAWIDGVLEVRSIAAAPCVFYIFRDEVRAQGFLAARVRRRPLPRPRIPAPRRPRVSEMLYEAHRTILDPIVAFIEARGRAPESFELPEALAAREQFGSVRAALAVLRRITGDTSWHAAQLAATQDLTVYLALAAFGRRPKFTDLPADIQVDVKAFFGSYKKACDVADALLFQAGDQSAIDKACRESQIGKLTPEALYVHITALPRLDPLLRVYEGCARTLTGAVESANIIKLNRIEPKVGYHVYPSFDHDPHPALEASVRADLRHLHVKHRDFTKSKNPPILHRKETFVAEDYPGRDTFARLTAQEEKHGLLSDTVSIGTRDRWEQVVASKGLCFVGHRLVQRKLPLQTVSDSSLSTKS
ncbi:MAG TPA: DNA phosphorothioation-associated putative methyltransferase [Ktedonobacterales bacterium]|nr:DNA phosphorothioation-associated putative methyltransferase [Ktedonobacterales bacterium]